MLAATASLLSFIHLKSIAAFHWDFPPCSSGTLVVDGDAWTVVERALMRRGNGDLWVWWSEGKAKREEEQVGVEQSLRLWKVVPFRQLISEVQSRTSGRGSLPSFRLIYPQFLLLPSLQFMRSANIKICSTRISGKWDINFVLDFNFSVKKNITLIFTTSNYFT